MSQEIIHRQYIPKRRYLLKLSEKPIQNLLESSLHNSKSDEYCGFHYSDEYSKLKELYTQFVELCEKTNRKFIANKHTLRVEFDNKSYVGFHTMDTDRSAQNCSGLYITGQYYHQSYSLSDYQFRYMMTRCRSYCKIKSYMFMSDCRDNKTFSDFLNTQEGYFKYNQEQLRLSEKPEFKNSIKYQVIH